MKEMKNINKIVCVSALFALTLISCTERLKETPIPDSLNTNTTIVSATVEPIYFEGVADAEFQYMWKEGDAIGLYGTTGGNNVKYNIVKSSLEDAAAEEGIAKFYGQVVSGDLAAYFPYSNQGHDVVMEDRIPIPAVQRYNARPYEQIAANAIFVAQGDDKFFSFALSASLLKLVIPLTVEGVKSVKITVQNTSDATDAYVAGNLALVEGVTPKFTDPQSAITITDLGGLNSTKEQPLVVYALVADGYYENFIVTLAGDGWVINKPLDTTEPLRFERGVMKECRVLDIDYNYGAGNFGSEDGSFTQQ